MIGWIVGSSLRARRLVVVAGAVTLVLGVLQLRHAKVDVLPEFGPPTVEVQTEALGLSAPEVEQLITVPLEQDLLNGVAWLAAIHSKSVPGLSSVEMIFEPGTDLLRARQVVQERISQAAGLPNVSAPPQMLQPHSSTSRVMLIGLSSKRLSLIEMSVLARWTIRPRLLGVPGVANVSIWGQRERQLQVQVDPERLERHGISLQQVIETTGNSLWASPLTFLEANTPGTGGFIDSANQRLGIQHLQPITTARELAQVPFEDRRSAALRLGDVATVVEDHQPLIGDAVLPDGPGLMLVVEKSPGANTLDVTHGVEGALNILRPGLSGVEIDPTMYRPATYIEQSVDHVTSALLIGFLLLGLALAALLFDWRVALIGATAILLSLVGAGLVLYLRHTTFNVMVLAGLVMALGIVIDDAIVDVENVARRLRREAGGREEPRASVVLGASLETRGAIAYATLIVLLAAVPLLFVRGEAGPFFPPLILSYALAVATSMVVALVVTPALSLVFLRGARPGRRESPVARSVQRAYRRVLSPMLRTPRLAYGGAGVVLVAGLAVAPLLGRSMLPSFRDSDLLIRWSAAPGTSLPEADRITGRVSRELRSIPGVRSVGAHVGRAVASDQVTDVDSGELWVGIDPSADYEATVASVRHVADGYPGIDSQMLTYPSERVSSILAETNDPIVVRVFGQDLDVLHDKAAEIRNDLAGIDGIVDPRVQLQVREPTVDVEVDLEAAKRFGIKPGDVRRAAATLLSGIGVGSLFEQQKVFDVVVWGTPETRNSLTSIRNLLIDTPDGRVRLNRVADVGIVSTPTVIRHEDVSRSIDVTAQVRGRDVGSVAGDVERRLREVRFPLEHHAELLGGYAERQAARGRVLSVAVAAAIGIFLLLQAAFGSWRLAAVTFLALPVALAGGVVAAVAGGRVLSLGSLVGLFAVFGIAARGAVTLIGHYRHLESEGETPGPELVLRGARERLVPILTTATATGLAFLPLVWSGGIAGQEIVHPMAVVILGGLVTSTLLNLFVVPVVYLRFGPRGSPDPQGSKALTLSEVEPVRGG